MMKLMPTIRLVHWKAQEAKPLIARLKKAGHVVDYEEQMGPALLKHLRERRPDVVVIDLSRLPSHGKAVAGYVRRTKAIREIPIVFHAGAPDKVQAVRALIPDAAFAPTVAALLDAVKSARPVEGMTAVPGTGIERPDRTAGQKLGIKAGARVSIVDPPRDYLRVLGSLPEGVEFDESGRPAHDLTLWFVHDSGEFEMRLADARKWAARTKLWVLWRKQATGKSVLTQLEIRRLAAVFGLVDYKICAVDDTWSGMLFCLRK